MQLLTRFNAIIFVLIAILVLFMIYGQGIMTRSTSHQSSIPKDVRLGEMIMMLPLAILPIMAFYATRKGSRPIGILVFVIGSLMMASSVIFLLIRATPFGIGNMQGGVSVPLLVLLAIGAYLLILGLRKIQR
ncbi:MAG TPA: hypothetical protein VJ771_05595 [Candidatus Nitrosotalea sp.]|nr:hypothetical protein [Candidatus Nitrosotalea sp.]